MARGDLCVRRRRPIDAEWRRGVILHANAAEGVGGLPPCSSIMLLNARYIKYPKDPDLGAGFQFISLDGPFPQAVKRGTKMIYVMHAPNAKEDCMNRMHIPDWADE